MTRNGLLVVLGVLLLIPGLCGAGANLMLWVEHIGRGGLAFRQMEDAIWLVAVPSLHSGLFGFWLIARAQQSAAWATTARALAWTGLAFTVAAALVFLLPPNALWPDDLPDLLVVPLIFGVSFFLLGLPCLRLRNPAP